MFMMGLVFQISSQFTIRAQDVQINFSIVKGVDSLEPTLPYIKIEYVNNSDKNYYFPAVISMNSSQPRYATCLMTNRTITQEIYDYCVEALYKKREFQGLHYYLPLSFLQENDDVFDFVPADAYENDMEYAEDVLNYYLYKLNRFNLHGNKKKDEEELNTSPFKKSTLKCYHNLKESGAFVFIKKKDSITQFVSLQGLESTGIILTILLSSCRAPQEMIIGFGNDCIYQLPSFVHGYHFYKGEIESNPITVSFSE